MNGDLIITNGDSAADLLRTAGRGAKIVPWRDVLHEGPVPATADLNALSKTRVDFLTALAWGRRDELAESFAERDAVLTTQGDYDRVVLWFEHDLYDQLQLLQVLDWFAGEPRAENTLILVQADDFLGQQTPETIARLRRLETPVSGAQLDLAKTGWAAFREPTPEAWCALLQADLSVLPFLRPAVQRMLEELPDATAGLARTEREILTAVRSGVTQPRRLFPAVQAQEEAAFMGDWSFWGWLDGLAASPAPLLDGLAGGPFRPGWDDETRQAYLTSTLRLTVIGNEVLAGKEDYATRACIDRWVGGTHLTNDTLWRWDAQAGTLIAPPSA